jgi:CheY-like chemotaxis protein
MPHVLALVDDLLFLSRIREAARGSGLEVRAVRRPSELVAGVRDGGRLVLVDADSARLPWADAVAALRREPSRGADPIPVVAFFSHVDAERAEEARAAGCDRVLPRGAFVRDLPQILAGTAARSPSPADSTP